MFASNVKQANFKVYLICYYSVINPVIHKMKTELPCLQGTNGGENYIFNAGKMNNRKHPVLSTLPSNPRIISNRFHA